MSQIQAYTTLHWPVIWRGALYFLGVVFPLIGAGLKTYAEKGEWPSAIWCVWMFFTSFGAGFLTLRAYCDGSAQRHSDEIKNGGTAFLIKQQQESKTP